MAAYMTPPLEHSCVAVINDDERFKTIIQRDLERDGYDVRRLRAGIGVHEVVRTLMPVAIAIDITRGGVDLHWRTLEALVNDPALADVPIVLAVADAPSDASRRALLLRPGLLLMSHPVTPEEVARAIRDMLNTYGLP